LQIQVLLQGAFAFIKIHFHGNHTGGSSVIFGETLALLIGGLLGLKFCRIRKNRGLSSLFKIFKENLIITIKQYHLQIGTQDIKCIIQLG